MTQPWFAYILYSVSTARLYIGVSPDPNKRLTKHNAGKGAKYTRYGRPWTITWTKTCDNKSEALKLEHKLKKLSRKEKLVLAGLAA